jgi:cephalosporin hydroxylase
MRKIGMGSFLNAANLVALGIVCGIVGFQVASSESFVARRAEEIAQKKTKGEWQNHWYGIPLLQYPGDLLLYQEVVAEARPDWIVETGTYSAGLTYFLSGILEVVHPEGKILTVDIDRAEWDATSEAVRSQPALLRLKERMEFFHGSSTAADVVERVRSRIQHGDKVLVLLDSAHAKPHVLAEMRAYGPLVTPGSYMIVTDTQLDRFVGEPGPLAAVNEFLMTNRAFIIDRSRERFLVSATFSGFLKRAPTGG